MYTRIRSIISSLFALAVLAGACWLMYSGVHAVWHALVSINSQLAIAVVTAATTLIVSTATVMLGRYYERKKEIEAHFRTEKIKIYDEFLAELFKVFQGDDKDSGDMVKFLREWQRKLVLWGGANVLSAYFRWTNRLKATPDAQTIFLMDEFFRALRADIGQNSKGLEKGAFANLILRYGDFFMEQAKRNPNITLEELSKLEKEHYPD